MLSPADLMVCQRDPALPGLPVILDAPALARAIGVDSMIPTYLRYKPGISCTAAFLHPEQGTVAVYAYTPERYEFVRRRAEWTQEASVVFLDPHCLVIVPAHLDRQLKVLGRYIDPDRRPKYLRRVLGRQESLCKGDLTIVRYKPARRLVARIDRKGAPRAALKITSKDDFNQTLVGATAAAAHGGAPLLGACTELNAILTGWIKGRSVCPESLGHAPKPSEIAKAGAALARLHTDTFRPAVSISPEDDAAALATIAADLGPLDAGLASEAQRIGAAIASKLADTAYTPTLVHGDFSADQVVITREQAIILDWDRAAVGDPARDIGSFLARIDAQTEDGLVTRSEAIDLGDALVDGYARAGKLLPAGIDAHQARALLMLATEGFRMRHANWPIRSCSLIERAESLIKRPLRHYQDPGMPTLDLALDTERVQPEIRKALGTHLKCKSWTLAKPELVRQKAGRRALARFRTDGADLPPLMGKIRAKGPDRHTPRVHRALRASGLDGDMDHGVGVPREFGRITNMNMWLQEEVPGQSLARYLGANSGTHAGTFGRTGVALARLHSVPPATDRRWTHQDELQVLDHALVRASQNMPEQAERLRAIGIGARTALAELSDSPCCGIHRDFYFDQVLVDGDRIWLVDLDLYAISDSAIDIGNFLAHLDELGLRTYGRMDAFGAEMAAFLDGYAAVRPLPAENRIATLRRVSLARHIHISRLFDERRHITRDLISASCAALTDVDLKVS